MYLYLFIFACILTTSLGAPPVQLSSDAGSDSHERFNSSITDAGTGQKQSSDESQRQSRAEKNEIISHLMGLLGKLPRSSPEQMKLLRRDDGENTHFGKLSLNPIKRLRDGYYSFVNGIVTFVPYEKVDSAKQSGFNKSDQPVTAQDQQFATEEYAFKSGDMSQDWNKKTEENFPSKESIPSHEKLERQTQPTIRVSADESKRRFFVTNDGVTRRTENEQKDVQSFSNNPAATENDRQETGLQPETNTILEAHLDENVKYSSQPMSKQDEAPLADRIIPDMATDNDDHSFVTKGARKDYEKLRSSPITLQRQPVIDLNPHRKTPLKLGGIGLPVLKPASGLDSMTFQPTAAWNVNDIRLNSDGDKFPRVKLDNGTVLIPIKLSDGLVLYSNTGFDNRPPSQMEQQLNSTIAMKQMDALFPGFEKALRNNFTQVIVQNIFFNIAEMANTKNEVFSSTTVKKAEEPKVTAPPVIPEETSPLSSFSLPGVGSDYDYQYDDDGYELKLAPIQPHQIMPSGHPDPHKATSTNLPYTKDDHLDHHVHHSLLALAEQLASNPSVSTSGSVMAPAVTKTNSHNLSSTTELSIQPFHQGTEHTLSNSNSPSHPNLTVNKIHTTSNSTMPFSIPNTDSVGNLLEEEAANGVSKTLLSSVVVSTSTLPSAGTSRLKLASQSITASQPVVSSTAVPPSTTSTRLTTISESSTIGNALITSNNLVSSITTDGLTHTSDTDENSTNSDLYIHQSHQTSEPQKITAITTPHNQVSFSPSSLSSAETTSSISDSSSSLDEFTTQRQSTETTTAVHLTADTLNKTSSTTSTVIATNQKSAIPTNDQSANWAMKVVQASGPKQQMLMKFMSPNMFKFMQYANKTKTQQETITTPVPTSTNLVSSSSLQRLPSAFTQTTGSTTAEALKIQQSLEQLQVSHSSTSGLFETSAAEKAEATPTTSSLQPEPTKVSTILYPFTSEDIGNSTPENLKDLLKEDVIVNKDQLPLVIPAQEPTPVTTLDENVKQETDSEKTTTPSTSTKTDATVADRLQLSEAVTAASKPKFTANPEKLHQQKLEINYLFMNDSGSNDLATKLKEILTTTKSTIATTLSDLKTISSVEQAYTNPAVSSTQKTSTLIPGPKEVETNTASDQYPTAIPSSTIPTVKVAAQSTSTPAITNENDGVLEADKINSALQDDIDVVVEVNSVGKPTPKFSTILPHPIELIKRQPEGNSNPWLMFSGTTSPTAVATAILQAKEFTTATGKFITPSKETTTSPTHLEKGKISTVAKNGSNAPTAEVTTNSPTGTSRNPIPSTSANHILKAPTNSKWTIMGPRRPAEDKPAVKQQLALPWYMTMYTTKNPMKTISKIITTSKSSTESTTTISLEGSTSNAKHGSHLAKVVQNREAATPEENRLSQLPSASTFFKSSPTPSTTFSTSASKVSRLPLWEEIPTPGLKVTKKPYILPITGNHDTAPTSLSYDFSLFTKPTSNAGAIQKLNETITDNHARRPTPISESQTEDSEQLGSHQNQPWPIFFVTDNPKGKPTPVTSQEENSLQDLPLALGDLQTTEPALKNEELSYVKGDALFSWQESENDDDPIEAFPTENRFSCNQMTKEQKVSFLSPKHPEPDDQKGICTLRIFIARKSVCQLRVDFHDVRMLLPRQGFCLDQYLQISGAAKTNGIERFCGRNPDQHFYVELEEAPTNGLPRHVDLTVVTAHSGYLYRYGMLIRQVECSRNNKLQAPAGCTQYFPQALGVIKSFNFDGGQYFNNQSYKICIRSSSSACAISFEASEANFGIQKLNSKRVPANRAGVGDRVCNRDYLRLPDGVPDLQPGTSAQDRYCGAIFSPFHGDNTSRPVLSFIRNKIIELEFEAGLPAKFNANHHGPGFKLSFSQLSACNNGDARRSRELSEELNRIVNIPSRKTSSVEHGEGSLIVQQNFSERLSYNYDYYDEFGDDLG